MSLRVYWPSSLRSVRADAFLVGWWLPCCEASARADGSVALVASAVKAASPEAARKLLDNIDGAPLVLGQLLHHSSPHAAAYAENEDAAAGVLGCDSGSVAPLHLVPAPSSESGQASEGCSAPLSLAGPWAVSSSSAQLVEYSMPGLQSSGLRYLLGVERPLWLAAVMAPPGTEEFKLASFLDDASCLAAAIDGTAAKRVEAEPYGTTHPSVLLHAVAVLCILLSGASACACAVVCPGSTCWRPLCARSALLARCRGRLLAQARWLALLRRGTGRASAPLQQVRLALLHSVAEVVADIVLGVFGFVVLQLFVSQDLSEPCGRFHRWVYGQKLISLVHWLMGAPADFKLNCEFTSFLGGLCIYMFSLWEDCVLHACGFLAGRCLHLLLCLCSLCGASLLLALCTDLVAAAALPLLTVYAGVARCWRMFLCSLYTLMLLFQGKKHNTLRSRVDHHSFDLEELLIGVVLLSVFVFLFPSIFMYYLCLAGAWLLVFAFHSTLAALAKCCSHLPLLPLIFEFCGVSAWFPGASGGATFALSPAVGAGRVPLVDRQAAFRLDLQPSATRWQPCRTADAGGAAAVAGTSGSGRSSNGDGRGGRSAASGVEQRRGLLSSLAFGEALLPRHGFLDDGCEVCAYVAGSAASGDVMTFSLWCKALAAAWAAQGGSVWTEDQWIE